MISATIFALLLASSSACSVNKISLSSPVDPSCSPDAWNAKLTDAWNRTHAPPGVYDRLRKRSQQYGCDLLPATEYYENGSESFEASINNYMANLMAKRMMHPGSYDATVDCDNYMNGNPNSMGSYGIANCCRPPNSEDPEMGYNNCEDIRAQSSTQPFSKATFNTPAASRPDLPSVYGYARKRVMRQVHGKSSGAVVDATLHIRKDLPNHPAFKEGLFKYPGQEYSVLLRWAGQRNFTVMDAHDVRIRSLAIKIRGVKGPRIQVADLFAKHQPKEGQAVMNNKNFIPDQEDQVMDVLMIAVKEATRPGGIPNNVFVAPTTSSFAPGFLFGAESNLPITDLTKVYHNPLRYTYGTASAVGMGFEHAAKWHIEPCPDQISKIYEAYQDYSDPDFMYKNLKQSLIDSDFYMCVFVQVQENPCVEQIENNQARWKSKPVFVGTIHVPQGDINPQDEYSDNTQYHPFRTLTAHKPLGSLNRLRHVMYTFSQSYRQGLNGATQTTAAMRRPQYSPPIIYSALNLKPQEERPINCVVSSDGIEQCPDLLEQSTPAAAGSRDSHTYSGGKSGYDNQHMHEPKQIYTVNMR